MQQTMQALQTELDSLRADNIKLYEKIKFLQSYPSKVRRRVAASVHSGGLASHVVAFVTSLVLVSSALQAGGSDDTVMRYSSQYEERLDPFASFSRKVRKMKSKN